MEKTSDEKANKAIVALIEALPGFTPLEVLETTDAQQRYALAQMYADRGFREYLSRSGKIAIDNLQKVETINQLWFNKGRIEVLKEILKVSKQMFEEAAKLDKIKE